MSIASWTSPPASALTFPISRVISSVSDGFSRSRTCAKRKRTSPRFGAGTSRHSSKAARAASTARATSSAPERGNVPSTSPVAGLTLSNVSPEPASTQSPPIEFWKAFVPVVATRRGYLLAGQVRVGKGSRDPRAAAVARLALLDELRLGLPGAAVGALTAVDDHRHVRVVLVVLDHLVVELSLELTRDHAIDHLRLIVGREPVCARPDAGFAHTSYGRPEPGMRTRDARSKEARVACAPRRGDRGGGDRGGDLARRTHAPQRCPGARGECAGEVVPGSAGARREVSVALGRADRGLDRARL